MKEVSFVAGIDIGGLGTKIGLVNNKGESFGKETFVTNDFPDIRAYIQKCGEVIEQLKKEVDGSVQIKAVGVGAPNANYFKGTIENPVNLVWKGIIPFVEMMKEHMNVPVVLVNDASAAAVGEHKFGGAKNMKNFIVITLGAGLGSGIFVNGELLQGHHGLAGEMGHMILEKKGRKCNSGKRGCLEAYVSVEGIKRTVFSLLAKSLRESEFRNVTFKEISGAQITKAAKNGDRIAIKSFELTGKALGRKMAEVVALFDPEAIFIAGGLAKSGELLLRPVKKSFEQNLFPAYKGKTKILISELLDKNAAILGAGALALEAYENSKGVEILKNRENGT